MTTQTLTGKEDTECRVCGYRWVRNVPKPKSCPDCKRRRVAVPISGNSTIPIVKEEQE